MRESTGNWITYTPGLSEIRNMGPVKVAEGEYFLLGDHRDNSNDSRIFGLVPMRFIHGRVLGHLTSKRPRTMLPLW